MSSKQETLETTLAYQQQTLDDLSKMVTDQWHEIDALKKQLGQMKDRLNELEEEQGDAQDESATEFAARNKPPHY